MFIVWNKGQIELHKKKQAGHMNLELKEDMKVILSYPGGYVWPWGSDASPHIVHVDLACDAGFNTRATAYPNTNPFFRVRSGQKTGIPVDPQHVIPILRR